MMKFNAILLALCLLFSVKGASYSLYLTSSAVTQALGPTNYFGGNAVVESNQAVGGWVSASAFPGASWIWDSAAPTNPNVYQQCFFSQEFEIQGKITLATLLVAADDNVQIAVNGKTVSSINTAYQSTHTVDISCCVNPGLNIINFAVLNTGGPAGLIYTLTVNYSV